jgi:carbonic anhydrase
VDDAVYANADLVARQLLSESPVLTHLVGAGKVKIVSAVYDLDSGKVEWGAAPEAPKAEHGKHGEHSKH